MINTVIFLIANISTESDESTDKIKKKRDIYLIISTH